MSWYKTGTISITNGSPSVVGIGTLFVDVGTLNAGDILLAPDAKEYEILSIQSNTGLTLASNYLGTTTSGANYAIVPIGLLPSALAQQVKSTLTTANTALASAVLSNTNTQGLTSTQQQNARTNIAALSAADVGAGRLVKSVAGNTDVTLTATEAANQFIELTGVLTGNINVIVPAAARLFVIYNATTGAFMLTVKTATGTGVAVAQGARMLLECDATNVLDTVTALSIINAAGGALNNVTVGLTSPTNAKFSLVNMVGAIVGTGANTFLQIADGANTSNANYLRVDSSTVPTLKLHNEATTGEILRLSSNGNSTIGSITHTISSVSYNTTSDWRLKKNPLPLANSGVFIDSLKPKTWTWQDGSKGAGFIAHEFQTVSPSSVHGAKDAVDVDGKPLYQSMQASSPEVMANIISELQSLRARVKALGG